MINLEWWIKGVSADRWPQIKWLLVLTAFLPFVVIVRATWCASLACRFIIAGPSSCCSYLAVLPYSSPSSRSSPSHSGGSPSSWTRLVLWSSHSSQNCSETPLTQSPQSSHYFLTAWRLVSTSLPFLQSTKSHWLSWRCRWLISWGRPSGKRSFLGRLRLRPWKRRESLAFSCHK